MRFISTFICVAILVTSKASKDANDSNLTVALVKALQSQLKTCMDQNRDLVQRSCQKSVRWGEHKERRAFAFHAELSKSMKDLPHDHKLVFDKVLINEGGAYSSTTGVFTCKVPGIYVFDWTVMTAAGKIFNTELKVDGVVHGRLNLDTRGYLSHGRSGSSTVIVKLTPGSKVRLEPYGNGQQVYGTWSFFSGYKM